MKIRNIFSLVLASSLLFASCAKEETTDSFDNIKVSATFVSLPADGGSVDLTVTATESWKFVIDENWPEKVKFNDGVKATHDFWGNLTNGAEDISSKEPSWVSASVLEGNAGVAKVTFTTTAFAGGREQTVAIVCGTHKQHVVLRQGNLDPETLSIEEALAAPEGKNARVKGTVTGIYNTTYGNWYLTDGTNKILVYGTLDKDGKEKNFSSLNIEEGDEVLIEGPISVYNGTNQLKNVTVVKHNKSLVKLISESRTDVAIEGETIVVELEYKGDGVCPVVPDAYQEWISILGVKTEAGEPSKLDPNPASKAFVTIKIAANPSGERKGAVNFSSSTSSVTYNFTQLGGAWARFDFNAGQCNFTIDNKVLPDGTNSIWATASYNGESYMKASGFISKKCVDSESWLISPVVNLTEAKSAKLTFTHALNNLKGGKIEDHIALMIKKGDAEWTNVAIPKGPDGTNYNKFDASIDLKDFVGAKVQLAFKYVSTTEFAPTWQIYKATIE